MYPSRNLYHHLPAQIKPVICACSIIKSYSIHPIRSLKSHSHPNKAETPRNNSNAPMVMGGKELAQRVLILLIINPISTAQEQLKQPNQGICEYAGADWR